MVITSGLENSTSLAGTWGDEQRRLMLRSALNSGPGTGSGTADRDTRSESPSRKFRASSSLSASREVMLKEKERFLSVTQATYTPEVFETAKNTLPTKNHKFKALQQTGAAVLAGQHYEGVDTHGFTTHNSLEESLRAPENNRLSTTYRDSYVPYSANREPSMSMTSSGFEELSEQAARIDLHRTNSKLLRTIDAPMAVGRSGLRKEKGVFTSGLSGEKLNLSAEPKENSFAQRSWLTVEDPALKIRYEGRPKPEQVTELSLTMPAELKGDKSDFDPTANYGRKYHVSGDILSKTVAARAGVFLDG